ncbi:hypothetical protein [Marinobacterium rhizophilum]|uniref:Filamentous hemagglutinin n=1 Tax=Marinobacterium rhizophilum TaxID=420402 RepID=A0ABY5HP96_9GAMM|nr:hypothetical protein [Marinobacterium rhizophilum]UTW13368.1 hypothetical protein KDW95_06870 [Marinobacterium rhizophilum]
MPLNIRTPMTDSNSLSLTPNEAAMMQQWESMTDDQKGEYLHYAKQQDSIDAYVSSRQLNDEMNSNVYQRLATGGVQVGGAVRPDAILTIDGIEMTAQQAVDLGVRPSAMIGTQTADLD